MPNGNGISGTNNNKNSKPRTEQPNLVVLTYSVLPNLKETLFALNSRGASVHYIIEENGNQIQFTNDATQQTFCCGKSEFRNQTSLNEISINMMLINDAASIFKQEQITKLIAFLQDLAQRYPSLDLKKDIAGLGEVAILKKEDVPAGEGKIFPRHIALGKDFPWKELADRDFGLFLETSETQKSEKYIDDKSTREKILALQGRLKEYGYGIETSGIYDEATKAWVTRFNQRYVPDATQQLDASLWSKASQLSLEHVLNYINENKKVVTQTLASSPTSLFKPVAPDNNDAHEAQIASAPSV